MLTSPIVSTARRTSQTAVASILRRYALSGLREIRSVSCLFCLLSHGNYLLDDLQGSGLMYSDRS